MMGQERFVKKRDVQPGIWEDVAGDFHFDIPSLLAAYGLPNTPENNRDCREMLMGLMAAECPGTKIIESEDQPKDN